MIAARFARLRSGL